LLYAPVDPNLTRLNGHEWAKRQLALAGVGYAALGSGFPSCEEPQLLQRLSDPARAGRGDRLLLALVRWLPYVLTTADLRAFGSVATGDRSRPSSVAERSRRLPRGRGPRLGERPEIQGSPRLFTPVSHLVASGNVALSPRTALST